MKAISRVLFVTMLVAWLAACTSGGGSSRDTTPPVISLTGDSPQVLAFGDPYTELGAAASDNKDGNLSASIVIDASSVDTSTPGDYTVTYNVTDAAGNAAVTVTRTVTVLPPVPEQTEVSVEGDIKKLIFSWTESEYTDYYRVMENPDGHSGFTQMGDDIPADTLTATLDIAVHFYDWVNAQYLVEACNVTGCSSSDVVTVTDAMLDTIGFLESSNPLDSDHFGWDTALSADGRTLVVGAYSDNSGATGINGDATDDSVPRSGAVYVYLYDDGIWNLHSYIKASNTGSSDGFGRSVDMSADGRTLAVGASGEDSGATGVNGDQTDDSAGGAGAAYVFRFDGETWIQQAYIKASNTDPSDSFGFSVSLSENGNTLVVGAREENSKRVGINGEDTSLPYASLGAAYVFRFEDDMWFQQAHIKSTIRNEEARFGWKAALSHDGNTLAVGAPGEDRVYVYRFDQGAWSLQVILRRSSGVSQHPNFFGSGIALSADGNTLAVGASEEDGLGAAYVFRYDGASWAQQAYLKSIIPFDRDFGRDVALSTNGNTLAVGTPFAQPNGGSPLVGSIGGSGAVYIFRFDAANWHQYVVVKAADPDRSFWFGNSVSVSADGETLVVGTSSDGVYVY